MIAALRADARALPLADQSVHCCVTSPPYWALRDYGDPRQIGGEATPQKFVEVLVEVFREVRRVLRDDGTLWLNLGDTYAGAGGGQQGKNSAFANRTVNKNGARRRRRSTVVGGLKSKDLVGIPWRVALALQDDGWYLRSDIIWHKPQILPESVADRPTRDHEYLFLLSKQRMYYYDADAIKERVTGGAHPRGDGANPKALEAGEGVRANGSFSSAITELVEHRNKRTVWTVPTQQYTGDHFAAFPEDLVDPCVLAGCPEGGTVLDPFAGTGTVGVVATKRRRRAILVELSADYHQQIRERNSEVQVGMSV